ncbi:hypothetical protein Drorol1_Dr00012555 [Drosera rotundifolia]
MELLKTIILNLIAFPLFAVIVLLLFPLYLLFKFLFFILNSFSIDNVAGKVVLITGASSGIGEHIAYAYARRGALLVLAARREHRLQEVADKARILGSPDVLVVPSDVSKADQCQRVVDETIDHFGRLDHLVNNAGVASLNLFEAHSDITNIKSVMEINLWGSAYTTKFAIPHLKRSEGKIIVIGSAAHWLPTPGTSIYNASKAAMVTLFETLRIELAPDITVTVVIPGFIDSEMTTQGRHLVKGDEMKISKRARDFFEKSIVPIGNVRRCSEAIVKGACRGDRYVTEPAWMKFVHCVKLMFPEFIDWVLQLSLMKQYRKPSYN